MSVQIKRPVGRPSFVQQMTEQALENIALDFIAWLEDNTRVASGESLEWSVILKRQGKKQDTGIGQTIEGRLLGVDYIDFAFFGRPPGKFPPISVIIQWINDRGLRPEDGRTVRQTAHAIARQIGIRGTSAIKMSQQFQRLVYKDRTEQAAEDFAPKVAEQSLEDLVQGFVDRTASLKNITINVS